MHGKKLHWFGLVAWFVAVAAGVVACAGAETAEPPVPGASPPTTPANTR